MRSALLRRRPGALPWVLLAPGLVWLALFFLVPLYYMAQVSLQEGTLDTGYEFTWHFSTYPDALSAFSEQFVRSFVYGGAATLLALLIAPFFTTYLIRTLAWQMILDDSSPVLDVLRFVGAIPDDGRVLATSGSVIAGITYNFLPFMILPLYAGLERIDRRLMEAARDLYSSRREVLRRVVIPLSAPGIVAGTLLTFIPAVGDFINAELLGTPRQAMIGNVIQSRFLEVTDYPTAAALSFMLMAIILVLVGMWARVAGTEALMGAEGR